MIKLSLKKVSAEMKKLGKTLSMSAITFSIVGCSNVHALNMDKQSQDFLEKRTEEVREFDLGLNLPNLLAPVRMNQRIFFWGGNRTDPIGLSELRLPFEIPTHGAFEIPTHWALEIPTYETLEIPPI